MPTSMAFDVPFPPLVARRLRQASAGRSQHGAARIVTDRATAIDRVDSGSRPRAGVDGIAMQKIDLKKQMKPFYSASAKAPEFVDVPAMNFLMIDGKGNPNTAAEYQDALEALYSVAYTIKFAVRKGPIAIDYGVPPLQGLWWADDMDDFVADNKDKWQWTMMIMQPEWVSAELVEDATESAGKKKDLPSLPLLRFDSYAEGEAAQILHVGPYAEEGPTIERLHRFIADQGRELRGKHHEIYLGDPRRADPAKLRTIIRQPTG